MNDEYKILKSGAAEGGNQPMRCESKPTVKALMARIWDSVESIEVDAAHCALMIKYEDDACCGGKPDPDCLISDLSTLALHLEDIKRTLAGLKEALG